MAAVLTFFQTFLAIGNTVIMCYACGKFLGKPKTIIESRLTIIENRLDKIDERLLNGNDRFREQDDTNQVLIHSVLALIEFEMQYCLMEHKDMSKDLQMAKESLHSYLSKR